MDKQEQLLASLTFTLQYSNPRIQASLLTEVVDYLPQAIKEAVLKKALIAIRAISQENDRLNALNGLVRKLSPDLLLEALAIGKALPSTKSRVQALAAIADYLTQKIKEDVLTNALTETESMPFESERLSALQSLSGKLPPNLLPRAIAITKALPSGLNRVYAIKVLALKLPPSLLLEALDIARAFRHSNGEYCLALALSALAPALPNALRAEAVLEALAAAESIPFENFRDNVYRAGALTAVIDVLPEALRAEALQKALNAARAIEEEWCRSTALLSLASKLPEALRAEILLLGRRRDTGYRYEQAAGHF